MPNFIFYQEYQYLFSCIINKSSDFCYFLVILWQKKYNLYAAKITYIFHILLIFVDFFQFVCYF